MPATLRLTGSGVNAVGGLEKRREKLDNHRPDWYNSRMMEQKIKTIVKPDLKALQARLNSSKGVTDEQMREQSSMQGRPNDR